MPNSAPDLRAVLDSNVIIAAQRSPRFESPNRELLQRWQRSEFQLLFSTDILHEYTKKLLALNVHRTDVVDFIALVSALGESVEIQFFHLSRYPADADDIAFLLCAWNGLASHLVSYDRDLLDVSAAYESHFRICQPPEFLAVLRATAVNEVPTPDVQPT